VLNPSARRGRLPDQVPVTGLHRGVASLTGQKVLKLQCGPAVSRTSRDSDGSTSPAIFQMAWRPVCAIRAACLCQHPSFLFSCAAWHARCRPVACRPLLAFNSWTVKPSSASRRIPPFFKPCRRQRAGKPAAIAHLAKHLDNQFGLIGAAISVTDEQQLIVRPGCSIAARRSSVSRRSTSSEPLALDPDATVMDVPAAGEGGATTTEEHHPTKF
jgi:hypothetical protein